MGATLFYKEGKYSQEKCEKALEAGYSVGWVGTKPPPTNEITIPITVKPVYDNEEIIGYNIDKEE